MVHRISLWFKFNKWSKYRSRIRFTILCWITNPFCLMKIWFERSVIGRGFHIFKSLQWTRTQFWTFLIYSPVKWYTHSNFKKQNCFVLNKQLTNWNFSVVFEKLKMYYIHYIYACKVIIIKIIFAPYKCEKHFISIAHKSLPKMVPKSII